MGNAGGAERVHDVLSLRQCFDRHGCDRGSRHGYERVYGPLFEPIRFEPLRILEIGIFRGAGIWAWLDYFPNAVVTGIDTFQRISPERVEVLKHERVQYLKADSTAIPDPSIFRGFDIIIDDGDHRADAQRETFENFRLALKPGGMYFIEDVWGGKPGYNDLIGALPETAIHYDLRNGGCCDSYIIQI